MNIQIIKSPHDKRSPIVIQQRVGKPVSHIYGLRQWLDYDRIVSSKTQFVWMWKQQILPPDPTVASGREISNWILV